jgi:hypothetical protein
MNPSRLSVLGLTAVLLLFAGLLWSVQGDLQAQGGPDRAIVEPTRTAPPPPIIGTHTPTPAGKAFAPAVFDTASTATQTPMPTATLSGTATPYATATFPAP